MAAAIALVIEMEKKRDAAHMSAAAVGFFLDREAHAKLVTIGTNQELTHHFDQLSTQNKVLTHNVTELQERVDYEFHAKMQAQRSLHSEEMTSESLRTENQRLDRECKRRKDELEEAHQETAERHTKYIKTLRDNNDLDINCRRLVSRISHLEQLIEGRWKSDSNI